MSSFSHFRALRIFFPHSRLRRGNPVSVDVNTRAFPYFARNSGGIACWTAKVWKFNFLKWIPNLQPVAFTFECLYSCATTGLGECLEWWNATCCPIRPTYPIQYTITSFLVSCSMWEHITYPSNCWDTACWLVELNTHCFKNRTLPHSGFKNIFRNKY